MHLGKIVISGTLEVLTPLHIGTGERCAYSDITDGSEAAAPVRINALQRDHKGHPYIPATSLKGVLRHLYPALATRPYVFGDISDVERETGTMGRLLILGATWLSGPPDSALKALPHGGTGGRDKIFVRARTRIDRRTGSAEAHRLFQAEMVPSGTRFAFSAIWLTDEGPETVVKELETVSQALAPLAWPLGIAVGRGGGKGDGRLRLIEEGRSVDFESVLGDAGEGDGLTKVFCRYLTGVRPKTCAAHTLKLECDGPFISVDPSKIASDGNQEDDDRASNIAQGLRNSENQPVLWPSSVIGALRERCSWIAECDRLPAVTEGETQGSEYASGRPESVAMDERDLVGVLDGGNAVRSPVELVRLSSVERLFGVTGWRSRVSVASMRCTSAGTTKKLTQVSIDRFTGGARDGVSGGALFGADVWIDPIFEITLELDEQHPAVTAQDTQLFKALLADITTEGLFLGHGAAKGYGWFRVDLDSGDAA